MAKKQIKKNGGSVASNRVNAFVPNFSSTPCKFKGNVSNDNNITNKFAINNYGSFFKTQGGKRNTKKKGGNNQYDTFKNYPVPYTGKNSNSNLYSTNFKNTPVNNNNRGGKKSKRNKSKKQKGSSRGPMAQRGDSNMITGAAIPLTAAQNIQNVWDGVTSVFTDSAGDVTFPSGLQLACNSNDCGAAPQNVKYVNNLNPVSGFPKESIAKSQGLTFPKADIEVVKPGNPTAPRAGGKRKSKSRKVLKGGKRKKTKNKKNKSKKQRKGGSNGFGSEFKATLASRGPYNYPNSTWHFQGENGEKVALNNFRAFNKSDVYIPPRTLSNGAAFIKEPPQVLRNDPYLNPWVTSSKISGYGSNGVATKNFNGAGRKKNKNII